MSSNPFLTDKAIQNIDYSGLRPMTVNNTIGKFLILMVPLLLSAGAVYYQYSIKHLDMVNLLMTAGMFIGLILSFIVMFKPKTAIYVAPIYAFCEGAFLSGVSCFFETMYPGIVMQAVALTFATAIIMGALFSPGASIWIYLFFILQHQFP